MALILLLKTCENLRGRVDRIARVTFRGMYSEVVLIFSDIQCRTDAGSTHKF